MMKIDCSRQTWTERTNIRRSAFLELLSEPKRKISTFVSTDMTWHQTLKILQLLLSAAKKVGSLFELPPKNLLDLKHFSGLISGKVLMKFILVSSLLKNIDFFGLYCITKSNKNNTDEAKMYLIVLWFNIFFVTLV